MSARKSGYKIAIGHKVQVGPYGGGNAFYKTLQHSLVQAGHQVYGDLNESNLDFIVLTDPRPRSPNVAFSAAQISSYLRGCPQTLVIHRINECDERIGLQDLTGGDATRDHMVLQNSGQLVFVFWL